MGVLLSRLEWYGSKGIKDGILFDSWQRVDVRKTMELKNNQMTIELKNEFGKEGGRELTGVDKKLIGGENSYFQVDDIFKFYCKMDKNNSGLDLSDNSNDLLFVGDLRQAKSKLSDKSVVQLICNDRTFGLLNGLVYENWESNKASDGIYTKRKEGFTSPLIIQDLIRKKSATTKPTDNKNKFIYDRIGNSPPIDANTAWYKIDARLKSENGFIQDDRSKILKKDGSQEDRTNVGTPDSVDSLFPSIPISTRNYNFPLKSYRSAGKPVYECLLNLSQTDMTNTDDETDKESSSFSLIMKRAMRFYLDERNRFHWFYPSDDVDNDLSGNRLDITEGITNIFEVKNHDLDFDIFDVINFVYYEAGKDMEGNSILGFKFDSTSGAPVFKECKRNWSKTIANAMKVEDNLTEDATQKGKYQYPAYPHIPAWNRSVTVNNNAEYNMEFRAKAKERANNRAGTIIEGSASQRWKGKIEFSFYNFSAGDLLQYTSESGSIYQEKMRITEIQHNINKSEGMTSLTVEADSKELDKN